MSIETIQIHEDTWRIENDFVRFFVLAGEKQALLIDSGVSCPEARLLAEQLTGLPVLLLNTHGDGDHVSGNGAFDTFCMHPSDYENCRLAERFPGARCCPLTDGQKLDLGGRVLTVLHIPGHTAGSVAVLDEKYRALYSGDSVQTGQIFMLGPHRRPAEFAGSLRKLMARRADYDVILPSHDTPEIPADSVEKVLADWEALCRGELASQRIDVHGRPADSSRGSFCGFYCDPKEA